MRDKTIGFGILFSSSERRTWKLMTLISQCDVFFQTGLMNYRIDETANPHKIDDYASWVEKQDADDWLLVCNGDENQLSSIEWRYTTVLSLDRVRMKCYYFSVDLFYRDGYFDKYFDAICAIGNLLEADIINALVSGENYRPTIQVQSGHEKKTNEYGFPHLADLSMLGMLPTERPNWFMWIQYFSNSVAENIDFRPEPFWKAKQGKQGWTIQLTETPLNIDNPDHRKVLIDLYHAFPKVGGQDLLPEHLKNDY